MDLSKEDWLEITISAEFGLGRAGRQNYSTMDGAIEHALKYQDIEFIVLYEDKYHLR